MPMSKTIYLDNVSSSSVHPEVLKTLFDLLPVYYANSDALHTAGTDIQFMISRSRQSVADIFHVEPNEIIFTSGATEANNTIIKGIAFANTAKGKHLITTKVEHSSVLASFEQLEHLFGFEVTYLDVDNEGRVSAEDVLKALRPDTTLVSVMYVNNEMGTIMPIKAISEVVKKNSRAYFHVDCVQALAKIDFDLSGIDCASFSMHKINGLKGSGLLVRRRHVNMAPLITGGQQEMGYRGGTSNAISHILVAKTMRLALDNQTKTHDTVAELNQYLRTSLNSIEGIIMNSPLEGVSPYIVNFSCMSVTSEVMMNLLNENGIYVSAQSTCASKSSHPSHVLTAMGVSGARLNSTIRIGLSSFTTKDEIDITCSIIKKGLQQYGKFQR